MNDSLYMNVIQSCSDLFYPSTYFSDDSRGFELARLNDSGCSKMWLFKVPLHFSMTKIILTVSVFLRSDVP